jgi:hypothetical protein
MEMSLRLEMWLECTVCHLPLHTRDKFELVLLGLSEEKINYQVCPKCINIVGEIDSKDPNYRRRYRRFVKKQIEKNS